MRNLVRRSAAVAVVVMVIGVGASAALAGTGVGATFNLGKVNSVGAVTTLTGSVDGKMLLVKNTNGGANTAGIGITVGDGDAPIVVNASAGKARNLDADELDGVDSTGFLRSFGKAANADLLDGMDSSWFLLTTGKAADSDLLDGLESTEFVQGGGTMKGGAIAVPAGDFLTVLQTAELSVGYICPDSVATNGTFVLGDLVQETVNYFSDNGGPNPDAFGQLVNGQQFFEPAAATGEHVTFSVQGSFVATIEAFSIHRESTNDCHVQVQITTSR